MSPLVESALHYFSVDTFTTVLEIADEDPPLANMYTRAAGDSTKEKRTLGMRYSGKQ